MRDSNNNQKGITLIALVITIVVLLILAGISVGALTGQNSIISETSKAKNETDLLKEKEQIEIALINSQDKKNKIDYNMLEENLKKVFNDKVTVKIVDDEYVITIDGLSTYHADVYGNIIGPGTINVFVEESNKDTSKDVVFYGYKLLESEIGLAVYFKMPEEKIKSGNEKIVFTQNDTPTTVEINEESALKERINGEDYYYAKFRCASIYMTDQIQFSFYDGDTKDSGDYTYSIKECANVILEKEIDSKTERFVKSILNYGGKAQIMFNHNTDNLANSGITFDDSYVTKDYLEPYKISEDGNIDTIDFYESLSCDDKINLVIYAMGLEKEEISNYKLYLDNIEQNFIWRGNLNAGVAKFNQELEECSKMHTIVVKDLNGNIVSNKLHYCVYSYCYKVINQGESANANLCKSIVAYTEAYKDYKSL